MRISDWSSDVCSSDLLFEQGDTVRAISIISEGIKNNPDAAEMYYRLVAYLFSDGQYNEALNTLQHALHMSPEKYELLFDYLPQLQDNKVIIDIINRYTRSEEHTSELQSLMRISYSVFCLK